MSGTSYFQNALSNFVTDAACGGAVRHLTDSGYTLDQIVGRLDYPASRAKVQRIMMAYLYESRVLLRDEPSEALFALQEQFVQEQDAYGRRTMRKVSVNYKSQNSLTYVPELTKLSRLEKEPQTQEFSWKELRYNPRRDGKLTELLYQKCEKYGETFSYVSCSFGRNTVDPYSQCEGMGPSREDETDRMCIVSEEKMSCLNGRQREYLQGIRWEQPVMYHRLNRRMLEIISKLYEAGAYGGACFFVAGREKLTIPAR